MEYLFVAGVTALVAKGVYVLVDFIVDHLRWVNDKDKFPFWR